MYTFIFACLEAVEGLILILVEQPHRLFNHVNTLLPVLVSVAVQARVPQILNVLIFSKWMTILVHQIKHMMINYWLSRSNGIKYNVELPSQSWWAWCRRPVWSWVGWPGQHLDPHSQGEGESWSYVSPTGTCPSTLGPCQQWYGHGPVKQCMESCSQNCRRIIVTKQGIIPDWKSTEYHRQLAAAIM